MDGRPYINFDISPDEKFIVFSSGTGQLFLYDLKKKQAQKISLGLDVARFPRFSSDGETVVFMAFMKDKNGKQGGESEPGQKGTEILYFRMADKKVKPLFARSGYLDYRPFFFRDSDEIGFARAHEYVDYTPGRKTDYKVWDKIDFYLLKGPGHPPLCVSNAHLSGGGLFPAQGLQRKKRTLYCDIWSRDGDIYFVDAATQKTGVWYKVAKKGTQASIWDLCVSPDERKIAFVADNDGIFNFNLYVLDVATKQQSLILEAYQEDFSNLVFSRDDVWVYFLHQSKDENKRGITLQRINIVSKVRQVVLSESILSLH